MASGQIVEDYLYDLVKTFQFVGRPAATIWQNYPRIIRAEQDQWARSQNKRPLQFADRPALSGRTSRIPTPPRLRHRSNYAPPANAEDGSGHQALATVVAHVRGALQNIAAGEFEGQDADRPSSARLRRGTERRVLDSEVPNRADAEISRRRHPNQ